LFLCFEESSSGILIVAKIHPSIFYHFLLSCEY
jgi:hypothetical protein